MSAIEEELQRDLKTAMLSGDKKKAEVLRGLKNALQYENVNSGSRDDVMTDDQAQKVLVRESKKRQEAAELYEKANEPERNQQELYEKAIIEEYLPAQLSEEKIKKAVLEEVEKLESPSPQDMGRVIGQVKGRLGASADGSIIARLTKEAFTNK